MLGTAAIAAASGCTQPTALRDQLTMGIRLGCISGCFTYDTPPGEDGTRVDGLIAKMKALGLNHLEIQPGDMQPPNLTPPNSNAPANPPPSQSGPYFLGVVPAEPNPGTHYAAGPSALPPGTPPGPPAVFGAGSPPRPPQVRQWWAETKLSYFETIARRFNDAGIGVDRFLGTAWLTEDELRRDFDIAKALGAQALGRPYGIERVTQMAREAERQKFPIYIHNENEQQPYIEQALAISPMIKLNFDTGNYVAYGGTNHIELMKKYHDRISHLHLKDRTKDGGFPEWGSGDAPVAAVLRLMRDEKYAFPAMIENERASRQARAGIANIEPTLSSTGKCVEYTKKSLA